MSQSATLATRNEATRRWKPPKVTPFAELAIGTAIRASHGRPRRVAKGCEQLRTVAQRLANTASTPPRPPRVKREPLLRIRGKNTSGLIYSKIVTSSDESFDARGNHIPGATVPGYLGLMAPQNLAQLLEAIFLPSQEPGGNKTPGFTCGCWRPKTGEKYGEPCLGSVLSTIFGATDGMIIYTYIKGVSGHKSDYLWM